MKLVGRAGRQTAAMHRHPDAANPEHRVSHDGIGACDIEAGIFAGTDFIGPEWPGYAFRQALMIENAAIIANEVLGGYSWIVVENAYGLPVGQIQPCSLQNRSEGSPVTGDMSIAPLKPHGEDGNGAVPMRLRGIRKRPVAENGLWGLRPGDHACLARRQSKLSNKRMIEGRLAPVARLHGDIENTVVAASEKCGCQAQAETALIIAERVANRSFQPAIELKRTQPDRPRKISEAQIGGIDRLHSRQDIDDFEIVYSLRRAEIDL